MARMSRAEFVGWQLFFELEPFGDEWKQTGTVAAAIGGGKPSKYIPFPEPPQTAEEMEQNLLSALGGIAK